MSLEKARTWMREHGRKDIAEGRSTREHEVLERVTRIAMDLDGVVLHQGAKAGQNGAQYDLTFGRKKEGRKTPVLFAGVLLRPNGDGWDRKSDKLEPDDVRLYLKLSEAGINRSDWSSMAHDDDGIKADAEWRYVEIPARVDISGEEILDLLEDSYFEVAGI